MEAYQTPAETIIEMLSIHGEVKKLEAEEMEKAMKDKGGFNAHRRPAKANHLLSLIHI